MLNLSTPPLCAIVIATLYIIYSYLNNQIKRNNYSESELIYGGFSQEKLFEIGILAFIAWRDQMINKIKPTLTRLLVDSISLLVSRDVGFL